MNNHDSPEAFPATTGGLTPEALADLRLQAEEKLSHASELEDTARKLRGQAKGILKSIETIEKALGELHQLQVQLSPVSKGGRRLRKYSWTTEVISIVQKHPNGVSYSEMKDILSDGPLQEKLSRSDKGFYGALLKLENQKKLVRHESHAFTPEGFRSYQEDVRTGKREKVSPHTAVGSPLTAAVLSVFEMYNRAITGREVVEALVAMPEVGPAIMRNNTGAYNVLSRLVRQGVIIKNEEAKTYRLPVPGEKPKEIGPNSKESGPSASEGGSSLNGSKAPNGALL